MTEKRFSIELQNNDIYDKETNTFYCDNDSICNLLNEQQELIEELHISDHMGWGRAEKFEKELKQKKIYIKRLEYKVQKFKEMNGEQQDTINELQSIINHIKCEENCFDYDYCCETVCSLYNEIKHLKEENEQLRQQQQRLYNYFRDYLEDEMSAENFSEMWDNVKEDERWNDE